MLLRTDKYRKSEDLAYGAVCGRNTDDGGRPFMGYLYLNFEYFNNNKDKHEENVATILHTLIHIMGFSESNFKYYLDDAGKPIEKDKLITTKKGLRGIDKVFMLNVPRLTTFAKKYF